jgi:hypothetical protein
MNIRELLDKLGTIDESNLLELTDQEKADLDRAKGLNKKSNGGQPVKPPEVKAPPVVTAPEVKAPPVVTAPEVKKSDEVEEPELIINQLNWIGMGAKGPEVEALQQRLKQEGFDLGTFGPNKDGIDGQFGKSTRSALMQFQQKLVNDNKMPAKLADGKPSVDGYFGPVTAKAAGMPRPAVSESFELNIANGLMESFGYVAEADYTDYLWKQAKQDASGIGDAAKDAYNWATSGHAGSDIKQAAGSTVDAVKGGAHGVAKDFRKFVDQPFNTQAKQIASNIQSGWAKYGTTLKDSPEALDAFVRGLANGITFGLADNVAAEVTALTSNLSYGKALQAELEKTKRYKEAHPYATTMGEFAGPVAVYKNLAMQLVVPELAKRYVTTPMNKSSMDTLHRQEADALLKEASDESAMIADGVNALQSALSRIVPGVQVTGSLTPQDIKAIKLARTKLGVSSDAEVLLKLLGGTTNESVKLSESEQLSRLKTILKQLDEVGGKIGAVTAITDLAKLGLKAESEVAAKEIVYAAGKQVGKEGLALALQEVGKAGIKIPVPKGTQLKLNGITFKSDPKSGNWFKRGGEQDTWITVSANDTKMIELGQTWKASEVGYGEWYNVADPDLKIAIEELGKKSLAYTSGKGAAEVVAGAGHRNDLIDWRGDKKTNPNYGEPAIGIKPGSIEEKDILKATSERNAAINGKQSQEQNVVTRYHDVPPGSKLSNYLGKDYLKDPIDNKWKYRVKTASGKEAWQVEQDLTSITDIEAEFNRRLAAGDASAWKNPNATSAGQGRIRQDLTGKYPTAGAIGRGLQALGRVTTPTAKALWEAAQNNPKVAAVIGAIALLAGGLYVWGGTGNIEGGNTEQSTPASLTPDEVDELENFVKKYSDSTDPDLMAGVAESRETLKKNGIPGY